MRTGLRQRMMTTIALPAEDVADAPDVVVADLAVVAVCRLVNASARIVSGDGVVVTFVKAVRKRRRKQTDK